MYTILPCISTGLLRVPAELQIICREFRIFTGLLHNKQLLHVIADRLPNYALLLFISKRLLRVSAAPCTMPQAVQCLSTLVESYRFLIRL